MPKPVKGHVALRLGRFSQCGASYFLTICTDQRKPGLAHATLAPKLLECADDPPTGWKLRSIVIMPDHVHLLIELTVVPSLSDSVRLFKGRSSVFLREHGLKWQRGSYDHRLRPTDDLLPVFLYILLNPYRADLLRPTETWQGYYCCADDWTWFKDMTSASSPLPEWLA